MRTEFKTAFNHDSIVTLSAFANTAGGTVYVGVADDGRVIGVDLSSHSMESWTNEIKQKTEPSIIPDIDRVEVDGKTIPGKSHRIES